MKVYILTLHIEYGGFEIIGIYRDKISAYREKGLRQGEDKIPSDAWFEVNAYEVQ